MPECSDDAPDRTEFTVDEHRVRHRTLHAALLELLGDYLLYRTGRGARVSPDHPQMRDPLSALFDWSARQIVQPSPTLGAHHEVTEATAAVTRLTRAEGTYGAPPAPLVLVPEPPPMEPSTEAPLDPWVLGDRVWWLRSDRHTETGSKRLGMPVKAVVVNRTATRLLVRVEGDQLQRWVTPERLRPRVEA